MNNCDKDSSCLPKGTGGKSRRDELSETANSLVCLLAIAKDKIALQKEI